MNALKNENLEILFTIFEIHGFELRIVGGAVRDHLMGLEPKDIDLVTDCPVDTMKEFGDGDEVTVVPTGEQHGTLTFVINKEPFEVTVCREDVPNTDGTHKTEVKMLV